MAYDGTFTNYQSEARKTAVYRAEMTVIYPTLGMCGEAGEAADIVKKGIRDGGMSDEQKARLRKELGDVLWYISNVASDMGWSLSSIALENLQKLADRQKRGVLQGSGDER